MFDWRDYNNGIYAFDSCYVRPILAAIHMVVEAGRVAFVDTGTNDSLPNALEALSRLGLSPDAVDYVILTHIHLDHAGGAGAMMAAFPNARLVVHPRGVRHMAEPARLVAGVTAVYGEDYVRRMYGEIQPIAAERIIAAPGGLVLSLAGRELLCLDTPGHARHHICIVDRRTGGIFSGDLFGLSYREHDVDGRPFIFPTTTPTQFEPEAMHASIDHLLSFAPEAIYLTHYSRVGDVEQLGADLHRRLDAMIALAEAAPGTGEERHRALKAFLTGYLVGELRGHGCSLPVATSLGIWDTDLELNAQGLEVWLDARAAAAGG
ncbi:MAG: MBL fold metallo-hydrolase [Betaproteobacteria bacterium]|nr:MBL fold metallo-hydrolase [Betaproteobacteria bacterium]